MRSKVIKEVQEVRILKLTSIILLEKRLRRKASILQLIQELRDSLMMIMTIPELRLCQIKLQSCSREKERKLM
jgi:hypothetical protein